jgi:excisionase family DNA binding protein
MLEQRITTLGERDHSEVVTTKEVAQYLRVHERTVIGWRQTGTGPAYRIVGKRGIRYLVADVIAWRDRDVVEPIAVLERKYPNEIGR